MCIRDRDFRNATDLFADKDFDGDPIRVKPVAEDTDLGGIIDEEEKDTTPIVDEVTGEPVIVQKPSVPYPTDSLKQFNDIPRKIVVNGVDVSILVSREMYFDKEGKPVTISLKDYSRQLIKEHYKSLDEFINSWKEAERKEDLINELRQQQHILDEQLRQITMRNGSLEKEIADGERARKNAAEIYKKGECSIE